jgi:hypothetical protein
VVVVEVDVVIVGADVLEVVVGEAVVGKTVVGWTDVVGVIVNVVGVILLLEAWRTTTGDSEFSSDC